MKLLLTADLHLGRTSTRLPDSWRSRGRTVTAWERLVDTALRESVSAVVLAGDVVDQDNRFWESLGPLREGVEKLHAAGILTLAVAGNHDAGILPALAETLPEEAFVLLGKNGIWERRTLQENGTPVLHIDGWSFPGPHHREDPTLQYPAQSDKECPVLGVVHGDLNAANSPYAPLSLARLQSLPVSGWLLGHIHVPALHPGPPWVLMPGTPHPLDPGEPGPRHAWLIDCADGKLGTPRPCCPAELTYRELILTLAPDDPVSPEALADRLHTLLQEDRSSELQSVRLRIQGKTSHLHELNQAVADLRDWSAPGTAVESVRVEARSTHDPESLAQAGPVPSRLAAALRDPSPELKPLLAAVCDQLNQQREFSGKQLPPLQPEELPLAECLEELLDQSLEPSA